MSQQNDPTPDELEAIQKTNIQFLEGFFLNIMVVGVPILTCINYKALQVVNNLALKDLLKTDEPDIEKAGTDD